MAQTAKVQRKSSKRVRKPANRWNLPHLGLGLGLRREHFKVILAQNPQVDFFEAVSEHYFDTQGWAAYVLDQVVERYPMVMHGISMSIGSTDPLNFEYLEKLKQLARRVRPVYLSDHLCWTGVGGFNNHDLLPMPYTEEALKHVVKRIRTVQDFLERPLFLENASTYAEFAFSTMTEWEFLSRMAKEADCGLLVDINNIYVSATNHGFDATAYIDAIPVDRIGYHHLAGHLDMGTYLLDTHDHPVKDEVWNLYRRMEQRTGGRTTVLEWDSRIPPFNDLLAELMKAKPHTAAAVTRGA